MHGRLQALLALLDKEPGDAFLLYGVALEYKAARDDDAAESYFTQLLALHPAYVPAFHQYGLLLAQQGRVADAVKILTNGIAAAVAEGDSHAAAEMEEALNEING